MNLIILLDKLYFVLQDANKCQPPLRRSGRLKEKKTILSEESSVRNHTIEIKTSAKKRWQRRKKKQRESSPELPPLDESSAIENERVTESNSQTNEVTVTPFVTC